MYLNRRYIRADVNRRDVGCVISDWRGGEVCFSKRIVVAKNKELLT
ncbi:MAG: hypothetical protein ACTS4W_00495 [Candidatus Hodgkinia cicadicola]